MFKIGDIVICKKDRLFCGDTYHKKGLRYIITTKDLPYYMLDISKYELDRNSRSIHKEKSDDEIYLYNAIEGSINTCYSSLRYGNIIYEINGKLVSGLKPVFVNKEEYVQAQNKCNL